MTNDALARDRAWTVAMAPGGLPLIGHALQLLREPLDFLCSLPPHGDLVEIRLGPKRVWLVCDQELVRRVLMDPHTYDKGGPLYDEMRPVLGNGLVTCSQKVHRRQRRLAQPCFRSARIADYGAMMSAQIDAECAQWEAGATLDVTDAMMALTSRVTLHALVSTSLDPGTAGEVRDCLRIIMRGVFVRAMVPLSAVHKIPTPGNRRFDRALARLHAIIDEIIAERRRTPAAYDDLLATLLQARDEDTGEPLTDLEAHDQLMTFLVAGIETAALALSWTFHLIGSHPEVERALHAEVDAVLGGKPPRVEHLPALDLTRRVFTEALRMYPPGWALARTTTSDTELAGRRLPTGSIVLYSAYVLHRDAEFFPDPERFDPDRWLPERAAAVPNGALLPFAAGNRKCIGDTFAMSEAVLAIAAVTARWRLRPVSTKPVRPVPAVVLTPGPLPMLCTPR